MESQAKLSKTIGIVGLGLIGGSLGLDLQDLGYEVCGLVHREKTAKKAKERGLAQVVSTNPRILSNCSVVILALPISQLIKPEQKLINALPKKAVITDVGSVKKPILEIWGKLHPHFIGSHPMAGNEKGGVEAGQKHLFQNKTWITTPQMGTDQTSLNIVKQIAIEIGSKWVTAEADVHDKAVSLISHLPVLVSAALLKTVSEEKDQAILNLAKILASSGFSDTTRVGAGNPELGLSMMQTNSSEIKKALNYYKESLNNLEEIIHDQEWNSLRIELEKNQLNRKEFI